MAQDEVSAGSWLTWTGTHWDLANGLALATLTAQRLGSRMLLETRFLEPTPAERRAIADAAPLRGRARDDLTDAERQLLARAESAEAGLAKRRQRRRAFAITSKNKGRMEAAMHCAAPRLRRAPDAFNPDGYRIATRTHTLTFAVESDPDCPDPDVDRPIGLCRAEPGHRRADWITAVIPQPYDPEAAAPVWRAFLARMLPDAEKRRTVQAFTGLALLAIPIQHLMFHYGLGANGKSVFLETVTRVLGPSLAVGLPRESIVGGSERSSGGASPDIVRLYGKRFVRILEVAGNQALQEDMIKRLTGGEKIPVRALYRGFFEFANFAKAHMSGNDFPRVDGQDNGIWRRLLVVHWDQTIPEGERGDFEAVVGRFVRQEGPGILNWMIEGVCDYLTHGLVIAPSVSADTRDYRDDMDPVGEFMRACVSAAAGRKVQAHAMYEAYISWSLANAKKAVTQTRFGKRIKQSFDKSEIGGRLWYQDCDLHDVPDRPESPQPRG
nr:DNA primase family protein [Methylobacterium fujisawaense]